MENLSDALCELLFKYTGYRTSNWTEVLKKSFEFQAEDGYKAGGCIHGIEYQPDKFFRIWGAGELHIEWKPDGTCCAYGYRYGGRPGHFFYAS